MTSRHNLKAEIRKAYLSNLISKKDMRKAIAGINKILTDESYAQQVLFNRDGYDANDVDRMMTWSRTSEGRPFWSNINRAVEYRKEQVKYSQSTQLS